MHPHLPEKDQRLVRLFVASALGQWAEVARVRADAPEGEPDREWREAMLQLHLFAGFPRTVEAYEILARAGGLGTPEPAELLGEPDRPERGEALFATIYGKNTVAVKERLHQHHADFGAWILGHAYGRVLSRPGLSAARRELLAVAALTALGQDRQLASHARGAIHCGATAEDVFAVLDVVADLVRPERLERATPILAKFTRAAGRSSAD